MHPVSQSAAPGLDSDEEEALAARHPVALLISGQAGDEVATIARRIHAMQFGEAAPFVTVQARAFPRHSQTLQRHLAKPMATAAGGSIFISDVEEMPIRAQDAFMNVLKEQVFARPTGARLMTGTTVSLLGRVGAGHFSEALFYRLNVIHLVA